VRTRIFSTTLLCAALAVGATACSGSDKADEKPKGNASEQGIPDGKTPGQVEDNSLKLGQPAKTVGDGGKGTLEITPDSVVFVKKTVNDTPENGVFAIVVMKDKATGAVAADEPAPITGQGWKWMAPDGEMLRWDSGNSTDVDTGKFSNADPVQPGAWQWRSQVFDLTEAQAKGGTLIYIDGDEAAHRWKMPSADSGPSVADVKKQLGS
jgi:hypothetical protein